MNNIDGIIRIGDETLAEPQDDKIYIKSQLLRDKATYENELTYIKTKLDWTNAMLEKLE